MLLRWCLACQQATQERVQRDAHRQHTFEAFCVSGVSAQHAFTPAITTSHAPLTVDLFCESGVSAYHAPIPALTTKRFCTDQRSESTPTISNQLPARHRGLPSSSSIESLVMHPPGLCLQNWAQSLPDACETVKYAPFEAPVKGVSRAYKFARELVLASEYVTQDWQE